MPSKKKPTSKTAKKPAKRVVAKKVAPKKAGKKQYSKGERTILIVAYSAFASVFILFATESDGNVWYYLLAFVCLAMVMRHTAGILKSYGDK